jgi:hypothetical protein
VLSLLGPLPLIQGIYIIKCLGDEVAQVVECLPTKHKALSSNPSASKKKKNWDAGKDSI